MRSRGSSNRLTAAGSGGGSALGTRVSTLFLAMFASMASVYVAGRLWQDAEIRMRLAEEIDKRNSQVQSALTIDETLKIIDCKEKQKQLSTAERGLAAARHAGFVSKLTTKNGNDNSKKKLLAVLGIITTFGRNKNRDAIRKAWMPTGQLLKKLEDEKGVLVRFVIGRSENRGGSLDREIDSENKQTNDFIILDELVEGIENPKKTKLFLIHAAENWNAEFYVKVNDDIYVNIDAMGAALSSHLKKPRVYIGCMKSGEVYSELNHKWYEPDWWKFGDKKSYFQHASNQIYAVSQALAQFISINRYILRTYAHEDVSTGSWFIGLDVNYISEVRFCCSTWSPGIFFTHGLHVIQMRKGLVSVLN